MSIPVVSLAPPSGCQRSKPSPEAILYSAYAANHILRGLAYRAPLSGSAPGDSRALSPPPTLLRRGVVEITVCHPEPYGPKVPLDPLVPYTQVRAPEHSRRHSLI